MIVFPVSDDRCGLGSGHGSRLHVHLGPCLLSDWRSGVSRSGPSVEALIPWGVVGVVSPITPIPKVSESFEANTCIGGTIELDVKSWRVTSLELSEPVKVDSAPHS